MSRVLLSIVVGLFTLVVAIGFGESLGASGPVAEFLGVGLAVAAYLALGQFFVAPKGHPRFRTQWPTMLGMGAPVAALAVLAALANHGDWISSGAIPMLLAACLGILVGAAVAGRVTFRLVAPEVCRRLLRTGALLLVAAAFVLAVGAVPLMARAGTFADGTPGETAAVAWGIAIWNLLVAACLAWLGARSGQGRRPSAGLLELLTFLAFVPACFLLIPALAFLGHGRIMLAVSVLMALCSIAEFVVTGLVGSTSLRLRDDARA